MTLSRMISSSAAQWPNTTVTSDVPRDGRSNHGMKPGGAESMPPLDEKSMSPSAEQKRMRVSALHTTRNRSLPLSLGFHRFGSLPYRLASVSFCVTCRSSVITDTATSQTSSFTAKILGSWWVLHRFGLNDRCTSRWSDVTTDVPRITKRCSLPPLHSTFWPKSTRVAGGHWECRL